MSLGAKRQAWIGLKHVKPTSQAGVLGDAAGAYATTLAFASSADEFRMLVEDYMAADELRVVEVEDVEPLDERVRYASPDETLLQLSKALSTEEPVIVDTFDMYPDEDEN